MRTLRHQRRPSSGAETIETLGNPSRRWILRLLVRVARLREFVMSVGFADDNLAVAIGLGKWVDCDQPERTRAALRAAYVASERKAAPDDIPVTLRRNLDRLGALAELNEAERQIFEFVLFLGNDAWLSSAATVLPAMSNVAAIRVLAMVLDLDQAVVRAALAPDGALARSGLVSLASGCNTLLTEKFNLPSDAFVDRMFSEDGDPLQLLRDTVVPAPPGTLRLADYEHVQSSLRLLRPLLAKALGTASRGVNVFFHGAPGTGKTELARLLAADLGCPLFEVASADMDGEPLSPEKRLHSLHAAQGFLSQGPALLVFDETEDVFNDGGFGHGSTARRRKAWINNILETNPVPTLWLSNSAECMDQAFLRRFDLILKLPIPPKRQRLRLLRESCGTLIDPADLERIAQSEQVTPAVLTRAAQVVARIADQLRPDEHSAAVVRLVENTLLAQGHRGLPKQNSEALPAHYDLRFLNADADLEAISAGIERHGSARLCLYGPPGTGKSAFARHLAERMQRPLHIRRASDVIDMYVGQTEKNLATVFQSAEADNAVLVLDEVDSFLCDRRQATRGWELSAVNEMLTQMEGYSGVFIASTNLLEGIDQAALRRFDMKLHFDYLRAEQAWDLFVANCQLLGLAPPPAELCQPVQRLGVLTPGDFAGICRRHRFRALADGSALLAALRAECALKEDGQRRPIGFV